MPTEINVNLDEFFASIQDRVEDIMAEVGPLGANAPTLNEFTVAATATDGASLLLPIPLSSNSGDNTIIGDEFVNIIKAGDGADTIVGGGAIDILLGGAGPDVVDYSYANSNDSGVFVDLGNKLAIAGQDDVDIVSGIESIVGTIHGDVLLGSAFNNIINGNGGGDFIDGRGGIDIAQFGGQAEDYTFETNENGGIVVKEDEDVVATLYNIEFLQFQDPSEDGGVSLFQVGAAAVAVDDEATVEEGDPGSRGEVTLNLLNNDQFIGIVTDTMLELVGADGDGNVVTPYGTLSLDANTGIATFVTSDLADELNVGDEEIITFSYSIMGGDTAEIVITVTGTNDAPTAEADTNAAVEDGPEISGNVGDNDGDVDNGHMLTYELDGPAPAGLTFETDGSYTFDPSHAAYQELAEGEPLEIIVPYTVTDEHDATASSTLTITVTGTNDAPTAEADTNAAVEDGPEISGNVGDNDGDVDNGHMLTYELDGPAPAGLTFETDGSYTFDPSHAAYQELAEGEPLEIVVPYTVTDEHDATASSTLTITVTGTNDAPTAEADTNAAVEDGPEISGNVGDNDGDVDNGHMLTYELDGPAPAGLTFETDGSYTFDPSHAAYQELAEGEPLEIIVPYTVTDEHDATASSTLTITVTGTNDAPTAEADTNAAVEDGPEISGNVGDNDGDVDNGHMLTYELDGPAPAGLTFETDGSYTFDPSHAAYQELAEGEPLEIVVPYTVTDEHDATASSTLTITVTGTNDAPTAEADTNAAVEDGPEISGNVGDNDGDVDNGHMLTYELDGPAPAGLTFETDGSYTFDPSHAAYQELAEGEPLEIIVPYTVTDEHDATASSTLTITVTGTNDAPTAEADTNAAVEDGPEISGNVGDNDGDVDNGHMLTYELDGPAPAGLTFETDGSYTFDPSHAAYQELAEGEPLEIIVPYTVTDEHGASDTSTLTITVTGTNDDPVAEADTNAAVEDGPEISGSVATNDDDVDNGAILTYSIVGTEPDGLTFNSDGSYSFDPSHPTYQALAKDEALPVVVSYMVEDEHGASDTSTLTITVTGTNDDPVAEADTNAAVEDGPEISGSVATNDDDVDNGGHTHLQHCRHRT